MLSLGDKNKIIALKEIGLSDRAIAKKLDVNPRTVNRFLAKLKTCSPGKVPDRFSGGSGRPRKMTPSKVDTIKRSISKNPMLSSTFQEDSSEEAFYSFSKINPTQSDQRSWVEILRSSKKASVNPEND